MKFGILALSLSAVVVLSSCSDDATTPTKQPLQVPAVYDSTSWRTNAATELGVRAALTTLTATMQAGRTQGTVVQLSAMQEQFSGMSPVTTPLYRDVVSSWAGELAKASGNTYDPRKPVAENGEGGVFGGYLFDEYGVEPEQVIEKGLFAGAMYNHALSLMDREPSVAAVDGLLAVYGAHPAFANTGTSGKPNRDVHVANYAARRSDTANRQSYYERIKTALLTARAAASAGTEYSEEYRNALATFRRLWEEVTMATVVNYLHSAIATMQNPSPTDAQLGAAMHAVGEAVGFSWGFKGIRSDRRIVTDTQIDELLGLMNVPATENKNMATLFLNPQAGIVALDAARTRIKNIYGFTDSQIEDFRINYVSSQKR
ncbi:MAG: hypothetical protein MUC47_08815 [Candidatus Kapabacteria bacterium]|nr:hypothetical protein [Candidatus Kapabacteria bacterium]